MERVVERGTLLAALRRVPQHGGSSGSDGMAVEGLPEYRRAHWLQIREALLARRYRPPPVKRVAIPKPGGGVCKLGMPPVRDRCLPQAMLQVWPPDGAIPFCDGSEGVRPGRSAHQAIARVPRDVSAGYSWVVDREKCFDRVTHEKLMRWVKGRVADRRV